MNRHDIGLSKHTRIGAAVLLFVAALSAAVAEESSLKEGAKKAGNAAGSTVRDVGEGAKQVGKDIGQGAKKVGKAVGDTAKEGVEAVKEGGKEFKRAVTSDR